MTKCKCGDIKLFGTNHTYWSDDICHTMNSCVKVFEPIFQKHQNIREEAMIENEHWLRLEKEMCLAALERDQYAKDLSEEDRKKHRDRVKEIQQQLK